MWTSMSINCEHKLWILMSTILSGVKMWYNNGMSQSKPHDLGNWIPNILKTCKRPIIALTS